MSFKLSKVNFLLPLVMISMTPMILMSKMFMILDKISVLFSFMSLFVMFLCNFSKKSILEKNNRGFSTMIFAMILTTVMFFTVNNIYWFFFFFEMSILPIFILIMGWGYQIERIQSSYYLLLYTTLMSFPFILIMLVVLEVSSPMILIKLNFLVSSVLFSFMILMFFVKVPVYFLHLWLPKAHVESNITGSIILAGLLLKLGGFGLIRVLFIPRFLPMILSKSIFYMTLMGCIIAMFICMMQSDQKSMIAYASVSHMTIMSAGIFSFFIYSMKVSLLLMFIHAMTSPFLFFFSYLFFLNSSNRFLIFNQGLINKSMLLTILFIYFLLLNFSVPPLPSFFSEIFLFVSVLNFSKMMLLMIGMVVFFSCCYSIYMLINSYHGKQMFENSYLFSPLFYIYMNSMIFYSWFMIILLNTFF